MRKVKLFIASSLDGFIAGEEGSIDWLVDDADYGYAQFYDSIDAILMGRKTYEQAQGLASTPSKASRYSCSHAVQEKRQQCRICRRPRGFYAKDDPPTGQGHLASRRSRGHHPALECRPCQRNNTLDPPVILGRGMPLFKGIEGRSSLKLVDSKAYPTGLAQLHYEIVHA